ncbi:MAG: ribonuclease HIII [Verrucomicrobium sp.]|nr:ribonuclease HIII [Verrucomicrobium sp.]
MTTPSSFTFTLDPGQVAKLRERLEEQGFAFSELPYGHFRAERKEKKVGVQAYLSGKLLVQGKGAAELVEFLIEPEIVGEARLGYDAVHHPEHFEPHLGIDESGKGDFFGPLVVAGVYTDGETARRLLEAGIKDSKLIGSDKRAKELAEAVREIVGPRCTVITMNPEKYNELHGKFRNLNRLLAWGHATTIENLLTAIPHCPRAVSDQFANPAILQRALKERGKKIELVQRTKAESDVAVAAASILARAEFLLRLEKLGDQIGRALPKGASAAVLALAKEIHAKQGEEALARVAKRHFRTFAQACGHPLPEAE